MHAARRAAGLLLLLFLVTTLPAAADEGPHRAALVVRYPDGRVQTRCVSFSEPSLTGAELLARSGLAVIINPSAAFGGAVCSIDNVGCAYPAKDCFCQCMGTQCEYWAYYHLLGGAGAWQYSQVGAAGYEVKDGSVEGWSWGPGNFTSGTEPPIMTFAQVCSAASAGQPGASRPAGPNLAQYAGFGVALLVVLAVGSLVVLRRRTT